MGPGPRRNLRKQNWPIKKLRNTQNCPQQQGNLYQSLSNAKREIRKLKDINWQLEWQKGTSSGAAQTYVELGLKPTSRAKSLPKLRLKREVQGWLIAAKSGHGHFSA